MGKKKCYIYTRVSTAAQIVQLMYRLYLKEGRSINGICIRINELGYRKTVRGEERPFTRDDVARTLRNPVYCRKIVFGRRSGAKLEHRALSRGGLRAHHQTHQF